MKKLLQLLAISTILIVYISSCSVEDGIDGKDGLDGLSIGVQSENNSNGCVQITFFKDTNRDTFLSSGESIIDTVELCNGEGGDSGSSIGLLSESVSELCSNLTFFSDANNNGLIDSGESVITEFEFCNNETTNRVSLSGYAQKGPFINGSSVLISELDSNFTQTGKSFNVQIENNTGKYTLNNIPLSSNYINTRVDGFYFNEITGKKSTSQITLNGIVDITDNNNSNLNVITHLEKSRVEFLLQNTELSFTEAKNKAQKEILEIFNINNETLNINSENMDLSEENESANVLLAVSSILQGYRSESDFSSLLADLITDIKEDGVVDNPTNGSLLLSHAKLLDPVSIKEYVENRYSELDVNVEVGNFSQHINNFVNNTNFVDTTPVLEYPAYLTSTFYSYDSNLINILNSSNNVLNITPIENPNINDWYVSVMVNNPISEMQIKVVIKDAENNLDESTEWGYSTGLGIAYFNSSSSSVNKGWSASSSQNGILTLKSSGEENYTDINLIQGRTYLAEVYINKATQPFRTITINLGGQYPVPDFGDSNDSSGGN